MVSGFNLLDLITKTTLDEILEGFTTACGIATFIVDSNGQPLSSQHSWTTLCRDYCRSTPKGLRKCYESDRYGGEISAKTKRRFVYPCLNAGLIDCTSPIIVGNYHIATFMCGQILHEPFSEELAIQHAIEIGIKDIDGYINAFKTIPIMSPQKLDHIVHFMEVVTRTISELAWNKYISSKQSNSYIDKLINRISDFILSIDNDKKISMVNDSFSRAIAYSKEQIIGQTFARYLSDKKSIEVYEESLANTIKDGYARCSLNITDFRSRKIPVHASIAMINGENDKYVAVLRDMTEEKKMAKLKEDLTGMMTHDLGNPILSIQKALQILQEELLGSLNHRQKNLIMLAIKTSQQLYGMLTDFLDIYRHENGRFLLRKQMVRMQDLVQESIKQIKLLADEKGVTIAYNQPSFLPKLIGDQNRLLRILLNLIGNAIKYSPEKGQIEINTMFATKDKMMLKGMKINENCFHYAVRPDTKYIITSVSDQGPGIPKIFQSKIFDKFFKLEKGNQLQRGTGLGLSFCKLAVEAHEGFIWVKSPDGNWGCSFYFALSAPED